MKELIDIVIKYFAILYNDTHFNAQGKSDWKNCCKIAHVQKIFEQDFEQSR